MTDKEIELLHKVGVLTGTVERLMKENAYLTERLKAAREDAQHLREVAARNWQTVEDVAIGVKLECPKCQKYHPCDCDR